MRRKLLIVLLSIVATLAMAFGISACSMQKLPTGPVQLEAPQVSISEEGVAQWAAVDHAIGYAYKLGDSDTATQINSLSIQLADGQSVRVQAWATGSATPTAISAHPLHIRLRPCNRNRLRSPLPL